MATPARRNTRASQKHRRVAEHRKSQAGSRYLAPMTRAARGRRSQRFRRRAVLAGLAVAVIALGAWTFQRARQPGSWQHVLATREGMIGGTTSSRTRSEEHTSELQSRQYLVCRL